MFIPDMGCRDTLLDLTICFGKLPDPWWGLWKDREEYYDEDGQVEPGMVVLLLRPSLFLVLPLFYCFLPVLHSPNGISGAVYP